MERRGGFHGQWPNRQGFGQRRPHPGQQPGPFSNGQYISPYPPLRHQSVDPRQLHTTPFPNTQYHHPYPPYQPSHVPSENATLPRQIPFTSASILQPEVPITTAEYQPLNRSFTNSGPVVHEGFIPAPGHEEDDEFDSLVYRDSFLQDMSSDVGDSEDEERLQAEEDRILREVEHRNDDEEQDADFSMDDMDDFEDDPDEMMLDGELDEDEEEEASVRRPRSNARGSRGRGRGGRGGRGSLRGRSAGGPRGGSREGMAKRTRNPRKPGRPPGKHGPRPTADPGPQFKELLRLANDAYLRKDYTAAIEYANKAIQFNPEIFAAHSLLSEIYADMGNEQKSLQALYIGAPTKRDKEVWFHIIDRVKAIDPSQYLVFTDQVKDDLMYDCLRAIVQIDGDDYEARSQMLMIDAKHMKVSRSVKQCRKMLTMRPSDDRILKMMAGLGTSSAKQTRIHLSRMISSFDTSIAYFLANDEPSASNLDWSLLNVYLELLNLAGDYKRALFRLKSLSRWIQGRTHETFWDDYQDDDREFDIDDEPRRIKVPEFSRSSRKVKYGKTLPLEIRAKLGLFRLRQNTLDFEEAMHHLEMLEPDDNGPEPIVEDYPDVFSDVADSLHASDQSDKAIRFYEPLYHTSRSHMTLKNVIGMYASYRGLDKQEKADELLPMLQEWKAASLRDMANLAKFFESIGRGDDAMKRAKIVFESGGYRLLRDLRFKRYNELREYFFHQRQRARGKHGARKIRVRKYIKSLRTATRDDESADESPGERSTLGLVNERPKPGLFRTSKSLEDRRPKTFLPDEIPGTDIPADAIDHSLFRQKLNDLANDYPEQLQAARAQHRAIVASFKRLEELSDAADDGDEPSTLEWISIAGELVEEFSTFDLFYYDRHKDFIGYFRRVGSGEFWQESALMVLAVVANNVEDGHEEVELKERPRSHPEHFYGIHFDKWLDLFAQYATLLARIGEANRCFSTLHVALQSNIFYRSQRYMHQLEICRLACALVVDDSVKASSAVRWFLQSYPFGTDLFRLYGCANRLCSVADGFSTNASIKVFLRYVKTMDFALLTPDQRENFNFRSNEDKNWLAKGINSESVKYVKDHDPALFALYGHILMCGGSYIAALNQYFRAFALTPKDPLLNLCIGIAYIQHAMKRLSENRQFQIQQGLTFVTRYHELRTEDNIAIFCSEAEFNLGRIWHSLGLLTQAIPAYERCIMLSRRVQEVAKQDREGRSADMGPEDFAAEAAFALQTIHALNGNWEAARKVTEEALVIE